jgi:lysosomal alpha-mannosidase
LSEQLPSNVHLLTFDQWTSKIYLVRVEHYFELNEDATFSKPVQFDLQILFNSLGNISDSVELILTANLPLNQLNRLVWTTAKNESSYSKSTGIKTKLISNKNISFYYFRFEFNEEYNSNTKSDGN